MEVQVCKQKRAEKMELNANIQLVINSFGTLFTDKIFSLTCFKFPDISRFSRQVVTLWLCMLSHWRAQTDTQIHRQSNGLISISTLRSLWRR